MAVAAIEAIERLGRGPAKKKEAIRIIDRRCILVDQQPEEDEHPDASDPYGPVPYDCNDIEQQGNVTAI